MKIIKYCAASSAGIAMVSLLLTAQSLWAQETKEKVTVDDVDRTFVVRLPQGYSAEQHYPVVILLHGMNQDAFDMERLTRFSELADKDGIITVYPVALHGRWNVGVRAQERRPMTMGPGRGGHHGGGGYPGGGYPGGGGGYPGGGGGYPRGGGGSSLAIANPRRTGPLRRTTSLFSTRCSTSLGPSFRRTRLESTRPDCLRVDS